MGRPPAGERGLFAAKEEQRGKLQCQNKGKAPSPRRSNGCGGTGTPSVSYTHLVKDGLLSISIQPLVMGVFFCYIAGLSLIRRGIERRREQGEK